MFRCSSRRGCHSGVKRLKYGHVQDQVEHGENPPFSSSNPPLFSLNETQPAHELSSLGALRAIWYLLDRCRGPFRCCPATYSRNAWNPMLLCCYVCDCTPTV